MKNILVPTDFSACADNAFEYALNICAALNGSLTVLHAQQVPILDGQVDVSMPERLEAIDQEIADRLKEYTEKSDRFAREKGKAIPLTTMSEDGFVTEQILKVGVPADYDFMVMGTKGATGLAAVLMGSITSTVITKTHIPVLVIPDGAKFNDIKLIVYASDFEEMDRLWLKDLMDFARAFNATTTCVHLQMGGSAGEELKLEDLRDRFAIEEETANISFDMIPSGDVEQGLIDYADKNKADLIAMLSHRRGFLDRLFHRSHTKQMTLHSHLPLLIFPEK
jgi:nucleotide-binding universal stress UspA family protein